uniref:Uncharacterized protein n=1 Tax=Chlamydomonas euryale TaxID=1486919 RepID=A0A7R9YU57_9CHLO
MSKALSKQRKHGKGSAMLGALKASLNTAEYRPLLLHARPPVQRYTAGRNFNVPEADAENITAMGNLAPEQILFVSAKDTVTRMNYLLVTYEVGVEASKRAGEAVGDARGGGEASTCARRVLARRLRGSVVG